MLKHKLITPLQLNKLLPKLNEDDMPVVKRKTLHLGGLNLAENIFKSP